MALPAFCLDALGIAVNAQPPELPAEAKRRLDHHVGEWEVRTEYLGRDGQVVRSAASRDSARYVIPGRVVELTSTASDDSISKAWMFYNVAAGEYCLTSVDGRGDLWVLCGGLDEYVITSEPRPHPRGGTIMLRFTHTNIQQDSFEALMEVSRDGGSTWWKRSRQVLTRTR